VSHQVIRIAGRVKNRPLTPHPRGLAAAPRSHPAEIKFPISEGGKDFDGSAQEAIEKALGSLARDEKLPHNLRTLARVEQARLGCGQLEPQCAGQDGEPAEIVSESQIHVTRSHPVT
jgi:hypothetical protein